MSIVIDHTERTPLVRVDRDKVEQILWNLLGNAVKFTPPEGQVTAAFTTTPDRFVQITITDTGCGIQPGDLPKIFNEFSKVSSAMPGSQGAQLGLCITKTLITMHGGSIRVDSTPGIGTRMIFTLPIADAQTAASHDTSSPDTCQDVERDTS